MHFVLGGLVERKLRIQKGRQAPGQRVFGGRSVLQWHGVSVCVLEAQQQQHPQQQLQQQDRGGKIGILRSFQHRWPKYGPNIAPKMAQHGST